MLLIPKSVGVLANYRSGPCIGEFYSNKDTPEFHYSGNRVKHIVERVRGALDEAARQTGTAVGDEAAVPRGADQGGEENVAGREGAGTQKYRGRLGVPYKES
jgi:hypothetical protein